MQVTDQERAAFAAHAEWLQRLLADGVLILAGPTLGPVFIRYRWRDQVSMAGGPDTHGLAPARPAVGVDVRIRGTL